MKNKPNQNVLPDSSRNAAAFSFDPANQSWVMTSNPQDGFAPLPAFDGIFTADPSLLAALADDYGHIIRWTPTAVLRPGSADDVVRMVRFAREHSLCLTSRGNGHTAFGQSQANKGVVIDLSSLNQIQAIAPDHTVVDAGVIWRDLLLATTAEGLTPPILTDYTQLTVGGTLAVGGVSGRSYQYGAQVDNVLELQVVTGEGQLITCSESENQPLFDAVLAGLGLCAIIVRATIRLIPAKERARTLRLFYPDAPAMLQDLRFLTTKNQFDHVRGNSILGGTPEQPSAEFVFFIEATSFYTSAEDLPIDSLAGLSFVAGSEQTEDRTYLEYTDIVVQLINALEAAGLSNFPHPWLDLFVPDSQIDAFASQTIASLDPTLFLPGSIILFFPFIRSKLKRPMLRVPEEDIFFLFDLLRTVPPEPVVVEATISHNRSLYERNRAWSGTCYTISAVPMNSSDWARHFQPVWDELVRAKNTYDPDNVLGAGLAVFE